MIKFIEYHNGFIMVVPIGSMYGIYANIGGILMGSMLPYIAYMDPIWDRKHGSPKNKSIMMKYHNGFIMVVS